MFITRVQSKGKAGRAYVSVLLRESKRVGKKVVSRTIAILTGLPDWLIAEIERALQDGSNLRTLRQLADASPNLRMRVGESVGAVHLVYEIAKECGIPQALGSTPEGKLALWQVLARVLAPATSLLGMVRLAGTCGATSVLGIKETFTEDDLYSNGAWLEKRQSKIEAQLWQAHQQNTGTKKNEAESLFLYDVTSSYFEGEHNALAEFGYNRDKVNGKRQVVMGLLTDDQGEPISVSLFPGNTSDLSTFGKQVDSLKETFGHKNITIVGDRGMIRRPQQKRANDAGFHYISALHKNEIETLLKEGEVQMGFFDNTVHETTLKDGRRLVTRCNPIRRDEIATSRQGYKARMEEWAAKANTYLKGHPKAKESTQVKHGTARLAHGKLGSATIRL